MVTQFGYAEELGFVDYANEQQSHLGSYGGGTSHSAATQKIIDDKVKELVDTGYETAKRVLTEKRDDLERLAQGLLEYETLTGKEIGKVIAGEALNRGDDDDEAPTSGGTPSITAIPKLPPKSKPSGDMEPEPTA
jgi:cell division protease FtsH